MAIDFFAHDPEEVLEPWQPKVGDRVRVTAAIAECPCQTSMCKYDDPNDGRCLADIYDPCPECPQEGHAAHEIGRIGVVLAVNDVDGDAHHVLVDSPDWYGHYAACELELLDKEAR